MHRMKEDHVRIVGQIGGAYKEIEQESEVSLSNIGRGSVISFPLALFVLIVANLCSV